MLILLLTDAASALLQTAPLPFTCSCSCAALPFVLCGDQSRKLKRKWHRFLYFFRGMVHLSSFQQCQKSNGKNSTSEDGELQRNDLIKKMFENKALPICIKLNVTIKKYLKIKQNFYVFWQIWHPSRMLLPFSCTTVARPAWNKL